MTISGETEENIREIEAKVAEEILINSMRGEGETTGKEMTIKTGIEDSIGEEILRKDTRSVMIIRMKGTRRETIKEEAMIIIDRESPIRERTMEREEETTSIRTKREEKEAIIEMITIRKEGVEIEAIIEGVGAEEIMIDIREALEDMEGMAVGEEV